MADGPRVLVVDDDPGVRSLLVLVCKRLGYLCETVADGAEALRKIRSETYDVVLLDLMMPKVNGYEVIAALRKLRRRPAVIVVTAMAPKETPGVDDWEVVNVLIRKPFDLETLCSVLTGTALAMYEARTRDAATS